MPLIDITDCTSSPDRARLGYQLPMVLASTNCCYADRSIVLLLLAVAIGMLAINKRNELDRGGDDLRADRAVHDEPQRYCAGAAGTHQGPAR
ncbi:MAG: hypothetical protein K9L88_06700 [Chromatiaceae bacterium]|nr:hypothetical protein [Chromatiaceae bacterium]